MSTADYAWRVDKDYIENGTGEQLAIGNGQDIDVRGPSNASDELLARLSKGEGHPFRLYDDDGGLNLSGRIIYTEEGVVDGFEPLDDYGEGGYGCTEIRFHQGGRWVTL